MPAPIELLLALALTPAPFALGQPAIAGVQDSVHLLWWNVENAFDTLDDPQTRDEAFTPSGSKEWTSKRYYRKLRHIAKGLRTAAGSTPPDFIGLCEIENATVLADLVRQLPWEWAIWTCHQDSPDARGIDVAVLYAQDRWRLDSIDFLHATDLSGSRDIVYTAFRHKQTGQTLSGFWVHLPSQRDPRIAQRIRALEPIRPYPHVDFLLGDLNSHPEGLIGANLQAYNWSCMPSHVQWGTYAFGSHWSFLDSGWRHNSSKWHGEMHAIPFGIRHYEDHTPSIQATFYAGRYCGGASDHLPLRFTLWTNEPLPYIYPSN
jgi:hypothetical protein